MSTASVSFFRASSGRPVCSMTSDRVDSVAARSNCSSELSPQRQTFVEHLLGFGVEALAVGECCADVQRVAVRDFVRLHGRQRERARTSLRPSDA